MNVTGPDWPSTRALREALTGVDSPTPLAWGSGGKTAIEQLEAFQAAGLLAPEFTEDIEDAKQSERDGVKTFGRRLHHTQGTDIIGAGYRAAQPGTAARSVLRFITTRRGARVQRPRILPAVAATPERFNAEWQERDFWVKLIPSVAEYRQHVWNGKCIRIGRKVQKEQSWRVQPVRSRNNGWHIDYAFKSDSPHFVETIRELARQAVAAVGYVGGAVDILEGEDGKLYVLEVNSAPALTDANTLKAYVDAITKWVRPKKKREATA